MKESEIYERIKSVADRLHTDKVYSKYSDCFTAAIEMCTIWLQCNALHKTIPYDSDSFLKDNQDL